MRVGFCPQVEGLAVENFAGDFLLGEHVLQGHLAGNSRESGASRVEQAYKVGDVGHVLDFEEMLVLGFSIFHDNNPAVFSLLVLEPVFLVFRVSLLGERNAGLVPAVHAAFELGAPPRAFEIEPSC